MTNEILKLKLEARINEYQSKEAECINTINELNNQIRTINENRLRFSGAILGALDQIKEIDSEEAAKKEEGENQLTEN